MNPKEILSLNESNYSLSFEKLKNSSKLIIQCIGKFISFIRQKDNENIKEFMEIFIPSLLGFSSSYSLKDFSNEDKKKAIRALTEIIILTANN